MIRSGIIILMNGRLLFPDIYSTRLCDKIAVFNKGKMIEYGSFEELMKIKGLYYDFFEKQAEYLKN